MPERQPMRAPRHDYSLKFAHRFCGLIAAGNSRNSLHHRPDMPNASSVTRWRRKHPDFDRMYRAACRERAERAARTGEKDPSLGGTEDAYTPERGAGICALVAEGWSLRAIARRPDAPCLRTLNRWQLGHEEFRAAYHAAWEQHAQLIAEENVEIADQALGAGWAAPEGRPPVTAREALMHAKLRIDARNGKVNRMTPRAGAIRPAEESREPTHEEWLDLLG